MKIKTITTVTTTVTTSEELVHMPGVYASPTIAEPGRWKASIRHEGKTIFIGYFNSELEGQTARVEYHESITV